MDKPISLQTALAFGLSHWALLVVAQAENIGFAHLGWLPLMQGQNVLAAGLVVGLALVSMRAAWSRWLFFVGYVALTTVVVVSPAYFQIVGDHPRLSHGEGAMTAIPLQVIFRAGTRCGGGENPRGFAEAECGFHRPRIRRLAPSSRRSREHAKHRGAGSQCCRF